jgi:glycosyltransferase involved in cell wall biosynthesis
VRILIDYRPALVRRSGAGHYVHELASALQTLLPPTDSLVLFSSSWRDRLEKNVVPGAATVDARLPVRALNYAWHRLEWPPVELMSGGIDVAHAAHPLLIPSRHAAQAVTIHDLDFLDHPGRTRAEIRRDYPELAPSHARRADVVVTISRHTAGQIADRLSVRSDRIVICPPGAPSWPAGPSRHGGTAGEGTPGPIVFIGTIEPRKNVGGLLRAYDRLVAARADTPPLILAGGEVERTAAILEPAFRAPLAGRVEYRGYVTDDERLELYRSASVVVIPSFEEGFGMTALEALTLGVPVVASSRGALPEVAGDAAILVNPDDDQAIARGLETAVWDGSHRARVAEAGPARARLFSWRSSAARLLEAYREAVAAKAGLSAGASAKAER